VDAELHVYKGREHQLLRKYEEEFIPTPTVTSRRTNRGSGEGDGVGAVRPELDPPQQRGLSVVEQAQEEEARRVQANLEASLARIMSRTASRRWRCFPRYRVSRASWAARSVAVDPVFIGSIECWCRRTRGRWATPVSEVLRVFFHVFHFFTAPQPPLCHRLRSMRVILYPAAGVSSGLDLVCAFSISWFRSFVLLLGGRGTV